MKFILLSLLLFIITETNCIESSDLCYLQCKQENQNCNDSKCPKEYPHNDGNDICTLNEKTLNEFTNWSMFLTLVKNDRLFRKLHDTMANNYQKFVAEIKECMPQKEKIIKADQVCVKRNDCFFKSRLLIPMRTVFSIKKVECKCPSSFSFECDKNLCSVDKVHCSQLLDSKKSNYFFKIALCK